MFYPLGADIESLSIWRNGKCVFSTIIGDERGIKSEYMNSEVFRFTFPKRKHALYVILKNTENEMEV